jgi:glutathione S-transferase
MIVVHSIPGSPYGRAAIIACIEKQAPWRMEPLTPGQHRGPEHMARHPLGRVPAIDDDGFVVYETQAILRYLDAVGPGPALTPADPKAAARMNQVIGVIDGYFFTGSGAAPLTFNRVVAPRLGFPVNEEAALAAIPATRNIVGVLAGFLEKGPYLAGETFSLADIHAGTHLDMLSDCAEGAEMLAATPLAAWLERLRARPSFIATTWDELAKAA